MRLLVLYSVGHSLNELTIIDSFKIIFHESLNINIKNRI